MPAMIRSTHQMEEGRGETSCDLRVMAMPEAFCFSISVLQESVMEWRCVLERRPANLCENESKAIGKKGIGSRPALKEIVDPFVLGIDREVLQAIAE